MLITFSDAGLKSIFPTPLYTAVERAAAPVRLLITWSRKSEMRFTLPGATTAQHESVILALLTLDPRATIRTSRARYAGLDDYKRQRSIAAPELSTGENQRT